MDAVAACAVFNLSDESNQVAINVTCGSCESRLQISEQYAGQQARCPSCQNVLDVPAVQAAQLATAAIGGAPTNNTHTPQTWSIPANPYAVNDQPAMAAHHIQGQGTTDGSEFRALHDCRFFLRLIAWSSIVYGVFCCLTIIGVIVGWLPIWIGIKLKKAADAVERGMQTGSRADFVNCSENLATFFKIIGVLTLINVVIFALYIVLICFAIGIGAAEAINAPAAA